MNESVFEQIIWINDSMTQRFFNRHLSPPTGFMMLWYNYYLKGECTKNLLLIYSPSGYPRCRWLFFLQQNRQKIFSWNRGSWWFNKMQVSCCLFLRKHIKEHTKLIPMALDGILRSYEENDQSVQETEHYLLHYYL